MDGGGQKHLLAARPPHVGIIFVAFMTFGACEWGSHRPAAQVIRWWRKTFLGCRNRVPHAGDFKHQKEVISGP